MTDSFGTTFYLCLISKLWNFLLGDPVRTVNAEERGPPGLAVGN
jgi:hypothetical protein